MGSCASLVADYAVKAAVYLPDDARELIASTIVIDTTGFSPLQEFRFYSRDLYYQELFLENREKVGR